MTRDAPKQETVYFLDPALGDPDAVYTAVDWRKTPGYRSFEPVRLTATVHADATLHLPFADRTKDLEAPAGSPAELLGRWSDGTLRLRVRVSDGRQYTTMLDGRFPAWVAEPDQDVEARGILPANHLGTIGGVRKDLLLLVAAFVFALGVYTWVGPLRQGAAPPSEATPFPSPSAASLAAAPSPTSRVIVLGRWLVGQTDGEGVYLRATPKVEDRLKAWPDGTLMEDVGPPTTAEGQDWRHVRAPDGRDGWIPSRYLLPDQ